MHESRFVHLIRCEMRCREIIGRTVMIMLGMFPCSAMTARRDNVSSFPTTSLKSEGRYFSNQGNSTGAFDEEAAITSKVEFGLRTEKVTGEGPFREVEFPSQARIS